MIFSPLLERMPLIWLGELLIAEFVYASFRHGLAQTWAATERIGMWAGIGVGVCLLAARVSSFARQHHSGQQQA